MTHEVLQYSKDQAVEILSRSASPKPATTKLSYADLVRAAAEVGVSEDAVQTAAQLLRERQSDAADWREFKRKEFQNLLGQSILYPIAIVASAVFLGPTYAISQIVTLVMLAVLALLGLLYAKSTQTENKFRKWRSERRSKALRTFDDTILWVLEMEHSRGKFRTRQSMLDYLAENGVDATHADKLVRQFSRTLPEEF